tara:strand:- start:501 stop:716 length:216 start_codon:yes stop_codon:yes gene_type:complete
MIENRYNVQLSTDVPEHKAEDFERWFDNVIGTDLHKDTGHDGVSSYVLCDITNYELRMVEDYENEYLMERE